MRASFARIITVNRSRFTGLAERKRDRITSNAERRGIHFTNASGIRPWNSRGGTRTTSTRPRIDHFSAVPCPFPFTFFVMANSLKSDYSVSRFSRDQFSAQRPNGYISRVGRGKGRNLLRPFSRLPSRGERNGTGGSFQAAIAKPRRRYSGNDTIPIPQSPPPLFM